MLAPRLSAILLAQSSCKEKRRNTFGAGKKERIVAADLKAVTLLSR